MRYTEAQMTGELLDQPEFTGKPIKIFICSTPRSGSYMLCRYMINAGLGVPHEYFNPIIMRQIATRLGLANSVAGLKWRCRGLRDRLPFAKADRTAEMGFLAKYMPSLIRRRSRNGIFAAKIHFDQYITVLDNPVGRQFLDGGLFIHLFREDLLKQAVSRNFAYLTGRWGDDDYLSTPPSNQTTLLEPKSIERELQTLADEDRGWRVFMAKNGLAPMSISYEQLCRDPTQFVASIARRIGVHPAELRVGYSEPNEPTRRDDEPGLPTKTEVAERYLSSVRQLHGAPMPSKSGSRPLTPVFETESISS